MNLFDPTGLRPITAEELDEYRKANSPKWGTALAVVAGVGLAFVPGAQGFAAALITGAVLGGGASIIDQACSGYPLDWKKVGVDALWGIAGGAVGWGIGKGIQWVAKTPVGQAAIGWAKQPTSRIPVVRDIAACLSAGTSRRAADTAQDTATSLTNNTSRPKPPPAAPEPPVPTASSSALADASRAAFRAAENPAAIFVKNKHLVSAGGRYAKFTTDDIGLVQAWVARGLRSEDVMFLPNETPVIFKAIVPGGGVIGTHGEEIIRVIVTQERKAFSVFPD